MSQPRKMLISNFTSENGTLIFPLLLCYHHLGFVCTKNNFSLSRLQRPVSAALYSQQQTQEEKMTRLETPV